MLAVFLQAFTLQILHSYHHHEAENSICESKNEQHIHSDEYGVHHCQLCDYIFANPFIHPDLFLSLSTENQLIRFSEAIFYFKKRNDFSFYSNIKSRGPPTIII